MIDTKALREKVLDLAIRGKLVPQDPNDEPATVLLERIREQKKQMVKDGKLKAKDIKNDTIIFKGDDNLHYEQFTDGTVKCIEDEIPFDLPDGWAWTRIKTVSADLPYGTSKKSNSSGKVAVLRMGNLQDGEIDYSDLVYSSDEADIEKYYLLKNDLLFNRTNSAEWVGKTSIYRGETPAIYAGYLIRIRTPLDGEYLNAVMNSAYARNYCIKVKTDAVNQSNINAQKLGMFLVPVAPIEEQHRIVTSFRQTVELTQYIQSEKNELTALIQSTKAKILDLAIRGQLIPQDPNDEPASVLLDRIRAEKEELIKAGKIKRDKNESVIFKGEDNSYYRSVGKCTERCEDLPFDLPKGWQWTSLGQYCEKVTDQVASGSFAALRENVLSLKEPNYAIMVKTADFSNNFTRNLTYTDKHGYEFLENSNLFGGELILSNIGSIGKVFIVPDLKTKMTLAPNSVMIRLTNNECKDYLYYFLLSPTGYAELKAISTGVAMLKFNKTDLKTIYFPLPPLAEQKRIVEAIENIFAQLDEISNAIA